MLEIIDSFKSLLNINKICIDNVIFKLHYKATFLMLLVFSVVVTARQYIGDPIDCIVDEIPQEIMDSYCWIYSTFTIPSMLGGKLGRDVASPGVSAHTDESDMKYHQYYQWVCIVLLIQAVSFYIPHYLWKNWEGKRMKMLSLDMNQPVIDEKCKEERKAAFCNYYLTEKGTHDIYFWRFFVCEILNFINVVGQLFFMNLFLGGEFLSYGHHVFQYLISGSEEKMDDPMARVFPKVTKCSFQSYGPSGGVQKFDGLCVLPVNILNEKIYFIIWFWFVILATVSGLLILLRILLLLVPWLRTLSLPFGFSNSYKTHLNFVTSQGKIGDWFILVQLRKNMDSLIFDEFIKALAGKLK